jgi:hypothetical protein
MEFQFEKETKQRELIKKYTRVSKLLGMSCIFLIFFYFLITKYLINPANPIISNTDLLHNIWLIVNVAVIMIMIIILGSRRTLYYSKRVVNEKDSLAEILEKWQKIDVVLIVVAEIIPLMGVTLRILGVSFDRLFHFFVGTLFLFILLTPLGIKVRSRLTTLKKHNPNIHV